MARAASGASRWAAVLGRAAVTAVIGGPLLAHFQLVRPMTGFLLFDIGGLLGLLALIVGIIAVVRGGGWLGLTLGAAVIAAFLMIAVPARKFPPINDITTDPVNPPQFVKAGSLDDNAGRNLGYPGAACAEQQRAAYPQLGPLPLNLPADQAFRRVEVAAQQMPNWKITRDDPGAHALEGTATSRLFRFQDDFVIEVRPQGDGSIVQMRSKSRDGKGDIGANAARIETFFARLRGH